MSDRGKGIYDRLPAALQSLLLTAYSAKLYRSRYGGRFKECQRQLRESQWHSPAQIEAYQNEHLERIVRHAYETVPYYRELFRRKGLKPADVRSVADLPKLPLLTRKDIQSNFDALKSTAFPARELVLGHTSGTTGSPLEVMYDAGVIHMTYALMDRQYEWAGARLDRFGDRIAVLRGNVIVPIGNRRPPFWRHNYYQNQMLLSSFHLSGANAPHYIAALKRFRPVVIDGYPSTVYLLARYLRESGESLPSVRAIVTSSETLYDFQRATAEEVFGCRVFDYYAAAERVIFATECDRHQGHHLASEYGITEITDHDGNPLPPGSQGLLVGTSLHNRGMPLLRYASSDISGIKSAMCPCGRGLPLMEDVSTKAEDIIALADGRMISPSVLTHPFKPMHSVEASQIVQEDYDHVRIRLVPNERYSDADAAHLVREFKARLGDDVRVEIEIVTELPRTKAGKFKWVVSKVGRAVRVPDNAQEEVRRCAE